MLAAVIAFSLMNYALLMIVARFREMTYRMREHGLIDDMDLIADEAKELEEAQSRSEWFWIRLTAPSAPYAVGFVGMAVSNMLIISCMCFFLTFFITGFTLFPGAARSAGSWIYTQIGSWVVIYPVVYGISRARSSSSTPSPRRRPSARTSAPTPRFRRRRRSPSSRRTRPTATRRRRRASCSTRPFRGARPSSTGRR